MTINRNQAIQPKFKLQDVVEREYAKNFTSSSDVRDASSLNLQSPSLSSQQAQH
jgi:hypothetical protein